MAIHLILGQKVKAQGHKVHKHIEGVRVSGASSYYPFVLY